MVQYSILLVFLRVIILFHIPTPTLLRSVVKLLQQIPRLILFQLLLLLQADLPVFVLASRLVCLRQVHRLTFGLMVQASPASELPLLEVIPLLEPRQTVVRLLLLPRLLMF